MTDPDRQADTSSHFRRVDRDKNPGRQPAVTKIEISVRSKKSLRAVQYDPIHPGTDFDWRPIFPRESDFFPAELL